MVGEAAAAEFVKGAVLALIAVVRAEVQGRYKV
jgi:hypothetical protein